MRLCNPLVWLALAGLIGCGDSASDADDDGGGGSGASGGGGGGTSTPALTWYRDVLPVAQKQCLGCHSDGGIGPFSMESIDEVQANAKGISEAVRDGVMPPWQPADDCQSFRGHRALTDSEKQLFQDWQAQGSLPGDLNDAPEPVGSLPTLPWVDKTVDIGADYTPEPTPGGSDDYRCFVLDPELTEDQDLIGYQLQPDTGQVHHVLVYEVDIAEAKAKDAQSPGAGYPCFGGTDLSSSMVGGWVPGSPPTRFPAGIGVRLSAGRGLVAQVHYNTVSVGPIPDRSSLSLQYAKTPVPIPAVYISLADHQFQIPPQTQAYSSSNVLAAPADGTIWGIAPHMHELGRQITVDIERPSGSECLIDIPEWDFNWQQFYFYENGISAEEGQNLVVNCSWDNPTDRTVGWGEGTTDEMCIVYFLASAR